jgi:glycerophosphoryl diester phosphodiesterase
LPKTAETDFHPLKNKASKIMALIIPKIIGHRGVAAYAPENTLAGIAAAAEMGVDWVELDVKLTKDQIPIIFHDDDLERTTNGYGPVMLKTYEDLRDLDCGSLFGDSFSSCRIPTLEEAVDEILKHGLGLNLEIKPCAGRERETAEVALDVLSQIWDDHDKLLISSFQHVSLEAALDVATDWHRGLLLPEDWPDNWDELAAYLQVSTVNVNAKSVTREQVEAIMDIEKQILAYTVNDPQTARRLQSWGVDGFFSDSPDMLKDALLMVH